jgi:predicted ATP-dependent endonuclease of OLD family
MKLHSLQISNILSFAYYDNIDYAPKITFEDGLNILIGQNGAGKSTALEVINFIFRRVLLGQFLVNREVYGRKLSSNPNEIKNIIYKNNNQSSAGFRLEANWSYQDSPQKIKVEIALDEIDVRNVEIIRSNYQKIKAVSGVYSHEALPEEILAPAAGFVTVDINLNRNNNSFDFQFSQNAGPGALFYLANYNYFRELIELHNIENPSDPISPLFESFALIGSYRNYHNFNNSVSISNQSADQQIEGIKANELTRSTNGAEQAEPAIFSLVRLLVAGKHYEQFGIEKLAVEAEKNANEQDFLKKINDKLVLVGLKVEVKLVEKRTWQYSFSFVDVRHNRVLSDINSLSAGQKAIVHLVFEAYGRGALKGGVVVIDEPEIHLHYQFQHEYLRVIEEVNKDQNCQYILVTHSESLINSNTISKVRRLALSESGYSIVKSPDIAEDQKNLVKILDNTRSTYAFFAKKVILVEGDSDRYLFKSILQELYPELSQEIAILDIGGKGNYRKWKEFFCSFGLSVYYVGDFDNVTTIEFSDGRLIEKEKVVELEHELKQSKLDSLTVGQKNNLSRAFEELCNDGDKVEKPRLDLWKPVIDRFIGFIKIKNVEMVEKVRLAFPDIADRIKGKYSEGVYLLTSGAIEEYAGGSHGDINDIAEFCAHNLKDWLDGNGTDALEIKSIINAIVSDSV